MAVPSSASLIEELRSLQILQPEQLAQLGKLSTLDARGCCRELMQRGWITPYQANLLLQGKGKELLIGSYLVLDRLGEGGMGQVLRARHVKLDRIVALKVIRKERLKKPEAIRRFQREARAAARLSHPNIVNVHDADEVNGTHFLAMELVEGSDLARLVKKSGPLPLEHACHYMRQAALGLQHAHERGLTHRDIKPHNLLVNTEGRVKVLDMGLARLDAIPDDDQSASSLTRDGSVIGTPDYLAPEQAKDARNADIRADIYSLGCTFYFVLTGKRPFVAESLTETLLKHQLEEPAPIRQSRNDVPAEVEAIIAKMMRKKPEHRYQKPQELADDLEKIIRSGRHKVSNLKKGGLPPIVLHATMPTRGGSSTFGGGVGSVSRFAQAAGRFALRSRRNLAIVSAAALLLLGAVVWSLTPSGETPAPPDDKQPPTINKPPAGLAKVITNSIDMDLVLIPTGSFTMGSPDTEPGRVAVEGPAHKVSISKPYYLGKHEVTAGEFKQFVKETSYRTEAEQGQGAMRYALKGKPQVDRKCNWRNPGFTQKDDEPVVCVSWNDADAFCKWLSRKEGKTYRLPTEAEWEYACRAGTSTPFSNGPGLSARHANCIGVYGPNMTRSSEAGRTVKVGQYKPNAFGLFDMHGNVWEWVADFMDAKYYQNSPESDPPGPLNTPEKIVRGGSWADQAGACRSASRGMGPPTYRDNRAGFRVALEP